MGYVFFLNECPINLDVQTDKRTKADLDAVWLYLLKETIYNNYQNMTKQQCCNNQASYHLQINSL